MGVKNPYFGHMFAIHVKNNTKDDIKCHCYNENSNVKFLIVN